MELVINILFKYTQFGLTKHSLSTECNRILIINWIYFGAQRGWDGQLSPTHNALHPVQEPCEFELILFTTNIIITHRLNCPRSGLVPVRQLFSLIIMISNRNAVGTSFRVVSMIRTHNIYACNLRGDS